jgi:hypothetical protein
MSTEQPSLFDPRPGIIAHNAHDTSRAAAVTVMPRTGTQRRRILDYCIMRGTDGATDLELQHALNLDGNTQRPRRLELVHAGYLEDSGRRRHGHIVWIDAELSARQRHPTG